MLTSVIGDSGAEKELVSPLKAAELRRTGWRSEERKRSMRELITGPAHPEVLWKGHISCVNDDDDGDEDDDDEDSKVTRVMVMKIMMMRMTDCLSNAVSSHSITLHFKENENSSS